MKRTPGVRSATLASQTPIVGSHSRATVRPLGRDDVSFEAEYVVIGPEYFETLGIPINRGRALGSLGPELERVVVVNEALAAMFWPGEDPVGQEIDRDGVWRVVGVSGDVQMRSLRSRPNPAVYYPAESEYSPWMTLHVAGERGAGVGRAELAAAAQAVDPEVPMTGIVDMQASMTASTGETRTIGYLVSAFAVLALTLAVVGLYGLVSFGASQLVREIGIRIALGVKTREVVH
ncbi:MAG: ABC transporter permease [Gemmatimonadetes bacterium]|nr:ABC transporter permease [Gemmatimonadota bacterium]